MSDTITLTRADGEALCRFFHEFWDKRELSPEEEALYFRVIASGNFGRPVRPHRSGPTTTVSDDFLNAN